MYIHKFSQFRENIGIREFPLLAISSAVVVVCANFPLFLLATIVAGNCGTTLLFYTILAQFNYQFCVELSRIYACGGVCLCCGS